MLDWSLLFATFVAKLRRLTMEGRTSYHYEPLRNPASFRILLLSGGSGDYIYAELIETDANSQVSYEAIYYVWGNRTKSHTIALRGGTTLPVTASLHRALRSIRHPNVEDGARAIWV